MVSGLSYRETRSQLLTTAFERTVIVFRMKRHPIRRETFTSCLAEPAIALVAFQRRRRQRRLVGRVETR
jgi:hypothetical protein